MPTIKTLTTYLEMHSPPEDLLPAPRADVAIDAIPTPSVEDYRKLYRGVGQNLHWVDRLVMPDDQLQAIIEHPAVDLLVLHSNRQPLGYAELDRRQPGEIELAYFGLFPSAIGQGLGKYLLNYTLHFAWAHSPRRVWVHTCDLDHPAALPNYLKAGFAVYDEQVVDQFVPPPAN